MKPLAIILPLFLTVLADEPFQVGEVVRLKGSPGTTMVVAAIVSRTQGNPDVVRVTWLDVNRQPQSIVIEATCLERVQNAP